MGIRENDGIFITIDWKKHLISGEVFDLIMELSIQIDILSSYISGEMSREELKTIIPDIEIEEPLIEFSKN